MSAQTSEITRNWLQEKGVKKFAQVWTADNKQIGPVLRLHHRIQDVDPELKLYAIYLEVNSIKMGGTVFVPVDFVADYNAAENKVTLSVPMRTVQRETWDRTPAFIAHHTSEIEELPL